MEFAKGKGCILVADDEEIFRRSTVDILRGRGYDADGVCDAFEGADAIQKKSYDLVIADIQMNGNSDLEFIRNTSAIKIPSMIVTAYPSLKSATESIRLMIVDYLIKPINPNEFLSRVEAALNKKNASSEGAHRVESLKQENVENDARQNSDMSMEVVLKSQIKEIYRSLEALEHAVHIASDSAYVASKKDLCELSRCSNLERHRALLREAVAVLVKTKSSFRSKELADLRARIETFLEN